MKNQEMKNGKRNKKAFKIRKYIFNAITILMGAVFMFSICYLDGEPFYIPLITLTVSGGWLVFMAWIYGWINK